MLTCSMDVCMHFAVISYVSVVNSLKRENPVQEAIDKSPEDELPLDAEIYSLNEKVDVSYISYGG
jgi:hypothetical protein